jgi:hypothetical protein
VQRAGPGDVPDVVPRRPGKRPLLPPAGHPGVHQPRIAAQANVGSDAEALGHSRPETLEQHIRGLDEPEQRIDGARMLQVQHGGLTAAVQQLVLGLARAGSGTVNAQHGRALVGEHHRAERPGPDARELEDPQAGQWPAASWLGIRCRSAHIVTTSATWVSPD